MRYDLATAGNSLPRGLGWMLCAALALALAGLTGCAKKKTESPEGRQVLSTSRGETSIQVVESEQDGSQIVRIKTVFRGEENNIVLNIDKDVYDVEIPLSVEQIAPRSSGGGGGAAGAAGGAGTPGGQFQNLLIAQYLERAQEAMLNGDYNGALRQVNLVLLVQPDHVPSLKMKGSIYYALGNYNLANEEWQRVLQIDPGDQEVRQFTDFLNNSQGVPQPPAAGGAPSAPQPPGTGQGARQ